MYIPELAPQRNHDHDYYTEGPSESDVPDTLTIEVPLEGFTVTAIDNLRRLIASKAELIKKALNAKTLEFVRAENYASVPVVSIQSSAGRSVGLCAVHRYALRRCQTAAQGDRQGETCR
jgi:hypothetical protein